jgi:putative transposase
MTVVQAYRFALDPSPAQERALRSHAGAARFAWNWGLSKCRDRYAAERKWYSGAELHKLWNAEKKADSELAWWAENSKCAYQEAFRDLDRALRDFIKSKKGQRKGRRLGLPKPKRRGKCRDSFRFGAGVMRCSGATVTLPRLGVIRTHESTRKLARRLEAGTARVLSATVSRAAQRWHVSFTVAGPKALRSSLRRLRRASRAHCRKQPGGANRRKSAARLARIHARVANVRSDALHKATSELAARYETVVAEDLNVTGMLANRRLARAVADQGFGQARRMLGYKTTWNGGTLIVADRWYPSSKTCSACGWRKPSLTLAERIFTCGACGLAIDRDKNAARNLLDLAASGAERLNACAAAIRPGVAGLVAMNQEPGTAHAGQTGTASWQREAAV